MTDKKNIKSDVKYYTSHPSVNESLHSLPQNLAPQPPHPYLARPPPTPPQPRLPQVPQQSMIGQTDQFGSNRAMPSVTTTMPTFNEMHGGVPSHQYNTFGQPYSPTSQFPPPYPTSDHVHVRTTMPSPSFNQMHGGVTSHQYNTFGPPNSPTSQFLPPYPATDPNMVYPRPPGAQYPPPPYPNFLNSQRAQSGSLRPNAYSGSSQPPPWQSPWFPFSKYGLFKVPSWEFY